MLSGLLKYELSDVSIDIVLTNNYYLTCKE